MPASRTRSQRVEAVLVVARGDDLAVELGRGVEVVVVVVEAGVACSCSAWPSFSMPSVQQVSSPSAFTARTMSSTGSRSRSFGPRHAAPMQKRVAPCAFAARAAATTASRASSASSVDAGVIALRLRAVAAVLGAAAGLDRQQRRQLHRVRRVVLAVHLLRAEAGDR